jgi:hypothetical protein
MKKVKSIIYLCIIAFNLMSCGGQTEKGVYYPKEKIMTTDKFDFVKYNRIVEEKRKLGEFDLYNHVEVLTNGNVVESSQAQDKSATVIILPPVPELIETYKSYHKNGFLESETQRYIGLQLGADIVKFGSSKYYDSTGLLIKEVDEAVKYENIKIKPLDLFEILKKEPLFINLSKEDKILFKAIFDLSQEEDEISPNIISKVLKKDRILNPADREDVKNTFLTLSDDEKIWEVVKDIYPFGRIEYSIDSNSGKIIKRDYIKETRP